MRRVLIVLLLCLAASYGCAGGSTAVKETGRMADLVKAISESVFIHMEGSGQDSADPAPEGGGE